MKKAISLFLVLTMCLGLLPVFAQDTGDTVNLMDVCPPSETPRTDYIAYTGGRTIGTVGGEAYGNGFGMSGEYSVLFNLNKQFETIHLILGHQAGYARDYKTAFFYLDGELIKEIRVEKDDVPRDVTLSVAGGSQLKIAISGPYSFNNLIFGEIQAQYASGKAPVEEKAPTGKFAYLMNVCPPYETPKTDYVAYTGGRTIGTVGGEAYGNGFGMSGEFSVSFDLKKQFETVTLMLGHQAGYAWNYKTASFYLDGELIKGIRVERDDLPRLVILPVAGGSQFQISVSGPYSFNNLIFGEMKGYYKGSLPETSFGSPADTWAVPELERAYELALVPETLVGQDLTKPITRQEFAAVCVKAFENLSGTKTLPAVVNPFTDTKDTEVLKAYNTGITNGLSATTFGPDERLNREMCATMLTRVFKRATLPGWTLATDGQYKLTYTMPARFADDASISNWAKDSVYFMAANKIINGMGNNIFAPRNTTTAQEAQGYANATREQALAIAVRMVENLR